MATSNITNSTAPSFERMNVSSLQITCAVYGGMMLVGWIAFEALRGRYPLAYSTRARKPETRTPLQQGSFGFLGWIKPTLAVSDEEVIEYCGLDALMFLRFQRLCLKVASLGILTSILVLPVYRTGTNHEEHALDRFSMANVRSGDARLYVAIVTAYTMALGTMALMLQEWKLYVQRRHEFLLRPNAHQYSILIDDLPAHLRTHATLTRYLHYLFPRAVREVTMTLEVGRLQKQVKERTLARNQLARAILAPRSIEVSSTN